MDSDSYSERPALAASLTRARTAPRLFSIERALKAFSPGERLALYLLTIVLSFSALALLARANALATVEVPSPGGALAEGAIGTPRFVNPLLALSDPDKGLVALVYSGLMRATPEGELLPDLAATYDVSEDGTIYTFTLRESLVFHDGEPLNAEDVAFTIQRAQHPETKSPRRADWEGVAVSASDERTVVFTLPHPYAPFLENTTLGILPEHLWQDVPAEEFPFHALNTRPVGSGPYEFAKADEDSSGALQSYELAAFRRFALGTPHLKKIAFRFYQNEEELVDAFNAGRIESFAGVSPAEILRADLDDSRMARAPLARTFGVFFNQNKNMALADEAVREALAEAIDKKRLVDDVLGGFGMTLEGPIPPGILKEPPAPASAQESDAEAAENASARAERAREILAEGGWTFDEELGIWTDDDAELRITLSTADEPALAATAERIAADWRAAGIGAEVNIYPLSDLGSAVLRPREYEAILFGEIVGRALDLFAFWHSSQRNDPGLNLALYTNTTADDLLAEARATTRRAERERLYQEFSEIVALDRPAVFLYAPELVYVVPQALHGVELGALASPAERFMNVHKWHRHTERVWNFFAENEII